ncbi:RNA-binding protein 5-B-like isoform X1 [Anopheles stephensi]|uniref:RNA-binding protein 5-B-like isoform X1 n=2 Tax=Anopheles stephensi TaxID=30069 RepID=UPI001658BFCD|nr:RNA-binding protein 5-B-like isoform X1 [Anopheles stephensi]
MDFSPSPDSDTSGYYRNRCRRDERDRGNRGRSKERYRNSSRYSRSRSRSYSRERYSYPRQRSTERDSYRDGNEQTYDDGGWDSRERFRERSRERDRDRRSRERDRYRDRRDRDKGGRRGGYSPSSMDDGENFDSDNEFFHQQKPNNNIIIRGLAPQVTEADINSDLIQCGLQALHVRLIRKRKTGESRGFAFVEFRTEEEATRWICYKQGVLVFNGQHAVMQYTFSMPTKFQTDWYCAKCYAFNFRRRENCFKCHASREDSEIGGDGSDEMSNILTKKIMLRNLDVLTNEESVMGVMQKQLPAELVQKVGKVVICRDPLTSISRGMCYVHFENLVDSMNTHNALKELDPPLRIDGRDVIISYCMDTENRNLMKQHPHGHPQGREGNRQGNSNQAHGAGQGNSGSTHSNSFQGNGANNGGYRNDGANNNYDRNSNYAHNHSSHGMNKNSGGGGGGGGSRGAFQDISAAPPSGSSSGPSGMASASSSSSAAMAGGIPENYTLADVPRLAEYSASMYASNAAEHKHYLQYYTEYYTNQLSASDVGQVAGPRAPGGLGETANNGAAVAQSAIARKQQAGPNNGKSEKSDVYGPVMMGASNSTSVPAGPQLPVPNGVDGRKYPTPDTSLYQYDETSGFYYDPTTGLYYDANSQYYYNSETSSYLYWDPENQTYVAAPASSSTTSSHSAAAAGSQQMQASKSESVGPPAAAATSQAENAEKMEKSKSKEQAPPQDKVKVAKKIVKDMEKWAKQLNQKKDYSVIQPPARVEEATLYSSLGPSKPLSESLGGLGSAGYADVGFSLLEKKERAGGGGGGGGGSAATMMAGGLGGSAGSSYPSGGAGVSKSVTSATSAYGGSDSDNEFGDGDGPADRDLVDFDRLTCLLCKRAFQSQEILMKHIKMSSLHKENLQKLNANFQASGGGGGSRGGGGSSDGGSGGPYNGLQYRDRAKERRAKYGEVEAPPVNRSKERFQREIEKQTQSSSAYPQGTASAVPIGQNNIGNKLLQKMGWSEGQGLGRSNQGRVNIIEAEARVANVGLGIKAAAQFGRTTDDYKTYIKKMMKSRYEQVDVKD